MSVSKTMSLETIAFAMRYEAKKDNSDVLMVSKALWLEIAELLEDTHKNLEAVLQEIESLEKEGVEE